MVHFFKQYWFDYFILCCLFIGCTESESVYLPDKIVEDGVSGLLVQMVPEGHVDSALVFFFKKTGEKDSLVFRQTIFDIALFEPHSFRFELPAGIYTMAVFGNVRTEYLVANPPYSSTDIYFDYAQGRRPSEIYFGRRSVNVGTDTSIVSGMIALSSFIQLTIHDVPVGISRIIVRILNTSAGFNLGAAYLDKTANPPLADTLRDIRSDSSYVTSFYCFPGIGPDDRSILEVECYDQTGQLICSGKSGFFQARPGYDFSIGCSFAATFRTKKGKSLSSEKLYFEIR